MDKGHVEIRKETKLVGYSVEASLNQDMEAGIVVELRQKLLETRHEIANQLENAGIYLVQEYPNCEWTPDTPFVSIAAVEVSEFAQIPEGAVQHTLVAGEYAKFTHKGPESEIGDTYDSIRETGVAADRPFDFEYWANPDALGEDEAVIDIYLPLKANF
ncbi:GyrI-like domain-containing protein [Paenibacillus sp. M.A.Huq-81]